MTWQKWVQPLHISLKSSKTRMNSKKQQREALMGLYDFDRQRLVFQIENLILQIENLIFQIENLIFQIENLIFQIENLIFQIEKTLIKEGNSYSIFCIAS